LLFSSLYYPTYVCACFRPHVNITVIGIDGSSLQIRKPYEIENSAKPIRYVIGITAGMCKCMELKNKQKEINLTNICRCELFQINYFYVT